MKKNIENSFKESLGNLDMPYNAAAWTSLSAKLDAKMPVTSPKSNFKWYAAASTIVVLAVSSYFIFKGDSETSTQVDKVISQNEVITPENNELNNDATNPVSPNNGNDSENSTENNVTTNSPSANGNVEPANGGNVGNPINNTANPIDKLNIGNVIGTPLKIEQQI